MASRCLCRVTPALVGAAGHFYQVPTKLRLDRSLDRANLATENDAVKLGHHLSRSKLAQSAPLFARRALRMVAGKIAKVGAPVDLGLEIVASFFGVDQDMASASFFGHVMISFFGDSMPMLTPQNDH